MESNLSSIQYRLLGCVEVHGMEKQVDIGGPKRRTVLATFLLQPNTVIPDERLIDMVWGQDPPRSARSQLQGHVHGLRKHLGVATIVRRGFGYLLVTGTESTDLQWFGRLLRQARSARTTGQPDEAARYLRTAISLWTAPALCGVEPTLISHARPALEEEYLNALEELYDVEIEHGRALEAIPELRVLCSENPARERFMGLLMSALHARGRTGEALEAYANLRGLLENQMGISPSASLQRLHQELLSSEAPAKAHPCRTETTTPRVRPAELPHRAHGLLGRASELRALDEEANGQPDPVLLITGVAGVGKTALALHWGHAARESFPDGQLYVDLAGSGHQGLPVDPDDALRQLLRSLGADPRHLPSGSPDLAKLLRSITADLRLLFFFDDAASAEQVSPLLPGGRGSTVLVTSRHGLAPMVALLGARRIQLDVLSEESSVELLRHIAGPEALAAGLETGKDIADHCGRLPLALRMTAAHMGSVDCPAPVRRR